VSWILVYTKQAQKDAKKLAQSNLKANARALLDILAIDPWQLPPPYKQLVGSMCGVFSRRINIQHRLLYQVLEKEQIVKVIRMWTHYEK
jgi:toxin YoeB